jgi:transposase
MGRGITLSDEQWDELDRLRFSSESKAVFRNCLIILKSDSRETIASIAEELGVTPDTVIRVRRAYRKGGAAALHPIKPTGRPSRATPQYIQAMRDAVSVNPLTLGYGFSNWSAPRLAAHLKKVTGISFGDDQLSRLLHRNGFSFQRPKHTMKGKRDEAAYDKAKAELKVMKKKR